MLCRRHHRAVHEEGYQVSRDAEGALRFAQPDGRALPEVPPPALVIEDPVDAIRNQNKADGLDVTPRTALPYWLGERLDLGWAINALHPLANPIR